MQAKAKRRTELQTYRNARVHAAGIIQAGRFVIFLQFLISFSVLPLRFTWGDLQNEIAVSVVRQLHGTLPPGSPAPFAAAAKALTEGPYNWPFQKHYIKERLRGIYDKVVRKRKHLSDAVDAQAVNPQIPPSSFNVLAEAVRNRDHCAFLERAWRATIESAFLPSREPTAIQLKVFSSNRLYRQAADDFRQSHMRHWALMPNPPQVVVQEGLPGVVRRVLRSFRGHRDLPGM